MFGALILLIFGKLQDTFQETSRTWQWALTYGVIVFLLSVGASLPAMIAAGVIMGLYAWGYFKLLRNLADNLMLWLLVFMGGAVLPMLLGVALIGAAQKAA
ncbi:hypothetical protein [Kingella oralis]|uniref:hypothetical protein n=1 Tax=Kingella oralis TaxID=505 RepID=UPI002D7E8AEE|nr:hypothetical protein [Kingella oralis]